MKQVCRAFLYILIVIYSSKLECILDGRTGNFPIVLDSTYTFSNFEWASGYVKFNNGFDIPAGTTALLDVNQEVNGPIRIFRNGTLILQRDIILGREAELGSDTGYIITNGHTIFIKGSLNVGSRFYYIGDILFDGMGTGKLTVDFFEALIAVTSTDVSFANMGLFVSPNVLAGNFPVFLSPGDIFLNLNNVTWSNSYLDYVTMFRLRIEGECRISGRENHYKATEVFMSTNSTLCLDFSNTLEFVDRILASAATLVMESSTLIYTRDTPYAGPSSFNMTNLDWIIKGKSNIKANGASSLITVGPSVSTFFEEGARLSIEPDTYLMFN